MTVQPITSDNWEAQVHVRMQMEGDSDLRDLFALWYLVTEPQLSSNALTQKYKPGNFGFYNKFNGVGVFVLKDNGTFKISVVQDLGVEAVNVDAIRASFKEGENGCTL